MLRNISSKVFQTVKPASNFQIIRTCSDNFSQKPLEILDQGKSINKVILLGRAVGPARINEATYGEIGNFVVVTSDIRRNRNDELVRHAEFHRVQIFNKRIVERARAVLDKNSRVFVEGRLSYNTRQREDGSTQYFTNVIAENVIFLTGHNVARNASNSEEPLVEENSA